MMHRSRLLILLLSLTLLLGCGGQTKTKSTVDFDPTIATLQYELPWAHDIVTSVAFTTDTLLAFTGWEGQLFIERETFKPPQKISLGEGVFGADLAVDRVHGRLAVATWAAEDNVVVYDLASGELLMTFAGHEGSADAVVFDPSGKTLFSGGADGKIIQWSMDDGSRVMTLDQTGYIQEIAISPDGTMLAASSEGVSPVCRLWNIADGSLVRELLETTVHPLTFSPDGLLIACGQDGKVTVVNSHDGTVVAELPAGKLWVSAVAFTPDGKWLAVGDAISEVLLFSTNDWSLVRTFQDHNEAVQDVAFSPNGERMVTVGEDSGVKLYFTTPEQYVLLKSQ